MNANNAPTITRADVEKVAADAGRPVLEVLTDLQNVAANLSDNEATLEALCAIKAQVIEERPKLKANAAPLLIARFQAGEACDQLGGAILVYLLETDGDPIFRLVVDGGELPEYVPNEYRTAKAAIRTASELCLTVIYDEVIEITETGEEDEVHAGAAGTRETLA